MAELRLEPCAVQLRWVFAREKDGEAWSRILGQYVDALVKRCPDAGSCFVAHVKGFAPAPGGYLRVNSTGAARPADTEVHSSGPCKEIELTLNLLVYGLAADTLAALATETAAEVAWAHGGAATLLRSEQPGP